MITGFVLFFRIIVKDTFDEDDGVANVVSLVRDDDVDVIFGSPSSKGKSVIKIFKMFIDYVHFNGRFSISLFVGLI